MASGIGNMSLCGADDSKLPLPTILISPTACRWFGFSSIEVPSMLGKSDLKKQFQPCCVGVMSLLGEKVLSLPPPMATCEIKSVR